MNDTPFLVYKEGRTNDTHRCITVRILFAPDTIRFSNGMICIRQKRKCEAVFIIELLLLIGFIGTDTDRHYTEDAEIGQCIPDAATPVSYIQTYQPWDRNIPEVFYQDNLTV